MNSNDPDHRCTRAVPAGSLLSLSARDVIGPLLQGEGEENL